MITTQNIYKAIKQRLSVDFPEITNQVKDIKNPQRPCFYVELEESHDREVANDTIQTTCTFNVVYYSSDRTLLDLTNIEKRLRLSFRKPLKVFTVFYEPLKIKDVHNIKSITNTEKLTINKFAFSDKKSFRYLNVTDIETSYDEYEYIVECSLGFDFLHSANISNLYDEYENIEIMEELEINMKEN